MSRANAVVIGEADDAVSTGYIPRVLQHQLHLSLKRFNVLVMHRRFGKSVFAINHIIDRALRNTLPMPRYAYIAPNYQQAKRVVWGYIKQFTSKIPGVEYNEAELRVDFPHNGARIMLLSGENPASIKGIYLDGVILDETADIAPSVWTESVRPTLSDRKGWAIFLGTPKGSNHFKELFDYACGGTDPEWYGAMFKASETKIIDEAELESNKRTMDEATYLQEYECSFSAGLVGAYFPKELERARAEKRVGQFPYDPGVPVDTGWDLGVSDSTAIWFFQVIHGTVRAIDYYETSGISLPEIVADLQKKPYVYGEHLLPHDAKARDLSTGRSIEQLLYSLGIRHARIIPRVGQKRDSINAARMLINKCYFDEEKCKDGIKSLYNYKRKWNEKNNCFDDNPLHDWSSNGADSFQQFALGVRDGLRDSNHIGGRFYDGSEPLEADTDYNPFERARA